MNTGVLLYCRQFFNPDLDSSVHVDLTLGSLHTHQAGPEQMVKIVDFHYVFEGLSVGSSVNPEVVSNR
jgi:hypothetical protein